MDGLCSRLSQCAPMRKRRAVHDYIAAGLALALGFSMSGCDKGKRTPRVEDQTRGEAVAASKPAGVRQRQAATRETDAALQVARKAGESYFTNGFRLREDYWGNVVDGNTPQKAIVQTLFKGNEYCFVLGCDGMGARSSVHIYDSSGTLVEHQAWQRGQAAAAFVRVRKTDKYYMIIKVEAAERGQVDSLHWALVYSFL